MKNLGIVLLLCCFWTGMAQAQQFKVSGVVKDQVTGEAVEMASIQLLTSDSTFVTGVNSGATGAFSVNAKKAGRYLIKVSFVGYKAVFRNVQLTSRKPSVRLGVIEMEENSIVLKGAEVVAKVSKVEMKADTFSYNAAAYRVPTGSSLEALVEQLPGAEVSEDGTIKINGKTVSQIMVNGKDFFKGDTQTAMKNLPVELINKIKAYDKQSDYSKQTGIDDGEEETVLDLTLKRELKSTVFSNLDLGYGTKDRYTARFFGNYFNERTRVTLFGSANNVNDRGFRGGGWWGSRGSLVANKNIGADFNWNNGKKEREHGYLELGGNVRYNHSSTDNLTWGNSETFLTGTSSSSFANNRSHSLGNSTNINAEFRLEWNPDTLTTIMARPSFSHSESNSFSTSRSATFNADPYLVPGITDPLESIFMADGLLDDSLKNITVNRNDRQSLSRSNSNNANLWVMAVRRLNNKGRNVSFNASLGYSNSRSKSFSISNINYFQQTQREDYTNQYSLSPSKNWNYNLRVGYSEPIFKNAHLQLRYSFGYKYSDSDRSLYQFGDSLDNWALYRPPLGTMPSTADSMAMARDLRNSQYATYKDYDHNVSLGFQWKKEGMSLNASVDFRPEMTKMSYLRDRIDTVITRNIFRVSPRLRFRYRISETSQLDIRYRGSSSEPSMTDLLDVTDDSDPLNITKGNPGLKPSWTNSLRVFYNNYIVEKQQGWMVSANYSQTSNSISNAMHYDETTGVRTTRPENINGNWDARGDFMFNTAFGPDKSFNMSTFTNVNYTNSVGYVSTNEDEQSHKNTTKTLGIGEFLRGSYRNDWLEVGIKGGLNYQHSRNKLQSNADMDTYTFNYGGNVQVSLPWNMQIASDFGMNSRRGYADKAMNTDEFIWNAQIAQNFLKGNAATLSFQIYDILHQQSNVSRTINAQMRSDSWNNAINSYCMVHFIYRLNLFGGKRVTGDEGGDRRRGPGGGPGRPMRPMGPSMRR